MEKWKKTTIELLSRLVSGTTQDPSIATYRPAKTVALPRDDKRFFKRARPAKHGIASLRLYSMLTELEGNMGINIHNVLVVKNAEVVLDASHPGYSTDMPHLAHSLSKTVTGIAIGMLIDAGRLSVDDKMVDYFPECEYKDKRFADITIDHLLRMSSGIPFAEIATVTSENWIADAFNTTLKFKPGEKFDYNSVNSYILSVILTKITGEGLSEFLESRLFAPLGIKNYFWERCSQGYEKGGWGLFLSAESFAKIGLMIASGGEFLGKRILSHYWVDEMTSKKSEKTGEMSEFDYGYHVWVGRENGEILFNGMFGQNVWICPKNQTIVVINAGNSELFQRSGTIETIRKYLGCEYDDRGSRDRFKFALSDKAAHFFESRHWIRLNNGKGILHRFGFGRARISDHWYGINKEYRFAKNNVGMLPFFLCLMQNNLRRSLESLSINVNRSGSVTLSFVESGDNYSIEFGLNRFINSVIDFRGEKYHVSAIADVIEDEDRNPVYKFELILPEMPNTRKLKITKTDGGILLRFSETPDSRLVTQYADNFTGSSTLVNIALGAMKRLGSEEIIESVATRLFEPTLVGIASDEERLDLLIKNESARLKRDVERFSQIMSFVGHFTKDYDDAEKAERRGPVAFISDLLRRKREPVVSPAEIEAPIVSEPIEGEVVALPAADVDEAILLPAPEKNDITLDIASDGEEGEMLALDVPKDEIPPTSDEGAKEQDIATD